MPKSKAAENVTEFASLSYSKCVFEDQGCARFGHDSDYLLFHGLRNPGKNRLSTASLTRSTRYMHFLTDVSYLYIKKRQLCVKESADTFWQWRNSMDFVGEKKREREREKGFRCTRIRWGWFLSGDRFVSGPKDDRAPFSRRFLPPIAIVYFRPKTDLSRYTVAVTKERNKFSSSNKRIRMILRRNALLSSLTFPPFPLLHASTGNGLWPFPKPAHRLTPQTSFSPSERRAGNARCEKPFANGAGKYRRRRRLLTRRPVAEKWATEGIRW